jgi:hypothetical protein
MKKKQQRWCRFWGGMLAMFLAGTAVFAATVELTPKQLVAVGKKIWRNECAGTVEGLTSWNAGEDFASLGIGHFIWYPAGVPRRFEESFPGMVKFVEARGKPGPAWLRGGDAPCPWRDRAHFEKERDGEKMRELRGWLAGTVGEQALFAARRAQGALAKMTESLSEAQRAQVRGQFERMLGSAGGMAAIVDYVNFKGEGVNPSERYQGEGWGLLQVLQGMRGTSGGSEARKEFARSAAAVLRRRVELAPAIRKEERWLPGWLNRCAGYEADLSE